MGKTQWQVSRQFITVLVVVFLLWLIAQLLFERNSFRPKAMLIKTKTEARSMSLLLGEQAGKIGGLTNFSQKFVLDSLFVSTTNYFPFTTNAGGEVVDIWGTPYQIKLLGPTNFAVASAGKNLKFDDADDIIFNSVSNNFVKP